MSNFSGTDGTSPPRTVADRFFGLDYAPKNLISASDIPLGDGPTNTGPEFAFPDTFFGVDIATRVRRNLVQAVLVKSIATPVVAVVYRPEDTWDRFWFATDIGFDLDDDGIARSRRQIDKARRESRFYLRTGQFPRIGNFHLVREGDRIRHVNNGISTHEGIVVSVLSQSPALDGQLAKGIAHCVTSCMSEAVLAWSNAHPDEDFLGQSLES